MTKKNINKNGKRIPIIFPINLTPQFAETASDKAPKEIHVLPVGKWNHPAYGPIVITREDIADFKHNFDEGLRKGIPITEGHEVMDEKPAVGWFTELIDRGANGLFAIIEWTEKGKTLLSDKAYKFFSPEFYSEYEDPETREIHENVLVGGALTNKPYFKELDAIVLSEQSINNQFNEKPMLKLEEVLAKKVEELSDEEKTFLQENKSELNDEQKETFKSVLEDEKTETDEEKTAREEKEKGDENEKNGLNRDGSAKELTDDEKAQNVKDGKNEDGTEKTELTDDEKQANVDAGKNEDGSKKEEKVDGSEGVVVVDGKVQMSQAAYKLLNSKANSGHEASKKLIASEIKAEATKLVFSEQNSQGRFLPKQSDKVFSFMQGLNEKQRKEFSELVIALPKTEVFNEVGHGDSNEGSAYAEIESKTKKLMSEDKALTYSDAVKRVCEEHPKLANQYETETA